jgi:asparagine synthase (glutamine-hydrolysing)
VCGFAGFVDFKKKSTKLTLQKMTDVLHHRGPDDSGYYFHKTSSAHIGLGHKRLSILDLSNHGHQPMHFDHLDIVYNGEVYNYKEIRNDLEIHGYTFNSNSDTEVILKAYHKWGKKCIDKLNGMFSIALYDNINEKFIFIRDRAGVKPFYYYYNNGLFLFSSELKSFYKNERFEKVIDTNSLAIYLQYGYILQPHTIFKKTYKLMSGHYLELDIKTEKTQESKYWDIIDYYKKPKSSFDSKTAEEKLERLLKSSFQYRMISDVPVGVFLSGGYDSSIVAAIIQSDRTDRLNTFTIGFHEKGFDEAPFAKEVANYLGTKHTEYYCTQKDALEIIPKLSEIYDEPFGDSSAIPTILVSQLAKQSVTVTLSSDGGDELFFGYSKYELSLHYYNKISKIPRSLRTFFSHLLHEVDPKLIPYLRNTYNFETKYKKLQNILLSKNYSDVMKYTSQHFVSNQIDNLIKADTTPIHTHFDDRVHENIDSIDQMLAMDYKTYMIDDILTKVDRATMSVSLEGREPFLDYRLAEFVAQLPSKLKYKNNQKKWLLKKIAHKYLPIKLMDRPKKGFGVPIIHWCKDELKEYFMFYLNKERLDREGLFNTIHVIQLRDSYLNGSNDNINRLWYILMFEMWYEKWI